MRQRCITPTHSILSCPRALTDSHALRTQPAAVPSPQVYFEDVLAALIEHNYTTEMHEGLPPTPRHELSTDEQAKLAKKRAKSDTNSSAADWSPEVAELKRM